MDLCLHVGGVVSGYSWENSSHLFANQFALPLSSSHLRLWPLQQLQLARRSHRRCHQRQRSLLLQGVGTRRVLRHCKVRCLNRRRQPTVVHRHRKVRSLLRRVLPTVVYRHRKVRSPQPTVGHQHRKVRCPTLRLPRLPHRRNRRVPKHRRRKVRCLSQNPFSTRTCPSVARLLFPYSIGMMTRRHSPHDLCPRPK